MEQVKDETIQGRAQTVTKTTDSSDHPLDDTWRQTHATAVKKIGQAAHFSGQSARRRSDVSARSRGAGVQNSIQTNAKSGWRRYASEVTESRRMRLALLVGVCVTGHNGADGGESDAGHGRNGSGSPHHPRKHNTLLLEVQTKSRTIHHSKLIVI